MSQPRSQPPHETQSQSASQPQSQPFTTTETQNMSQPLSQPPRRVISLIDRLRAEYTETSIMVVGMAELPNGDWTNAEGADLTPTCYDVVAQCRPAHGRGDFDMIDFGSFMEYEKAIEVASAVAESVTGDAHGFDIL